MKHTLHVALNSQPFASVQAHNAVDAARQRIGSDSTGRREGQVCVRDKEGVSIDFSYSIDQLPSGPSIRLELETISVPPVKTAA